jgi:predicted PurR-regulated permease PerM
LLSYPDDRLLYGALAILVAVVLARVLKWVVLRLEQHHPGEERELVRLRRRETALVLFATAIPYATAIVVLVVVEPAKASGFVEQFGLRTTVLRSLNGDRVFAPNSQIITAVRTTHGYRRYSIELLTQIPNGGTHSFSNIVITSFGFTDLQFAINPGTNPQPVSPG